MPANLDDGRCKNVKVELDLISIRTLVLCLIFMPVTVLVCCFVTAKIFQNEETYDLHACNKPNFIPSISAVTGIVPQVYFWRFCVAFVVAPKIFLAELYKTYFNCLADTVNLERTKRITYWLSLVCFWCNVVDSCALCGLCFVSDKENYSIHEKCFCIFMACSLANMLLIIIKYMIYREYLSPDTIISLRLKVGFFILAIFSGLNLVIFYEIHILWCVDNAFSWFSLSEYGIIGCILGFHWTIVLDFPKKRVKMEIIN